MLRRELIGLAFLTCAACGTAEAVGARRDGLAKLTDRAAVRGARKCSPEELALARAHLSFADLELREGDPGRAVEHLILGEANAKAALRLSPKGKCSQGGDRDGDGILDAEDACPDRPEDLDGVDDEDGCPDSFDGDGDGVADDVDLCPDAAEDPDGFLDEDGCPERDNDLDGVADEADRCPREGEDPDGFADEDGCPDADNDGDAVPDADDACPNEPGQPAQKGCPKQYRDVVVTADRVMITQQVHFETGRAQIRADSHVLLDTVAEALRDYPEIEVEIQGHTDSRGPDQRNLKLSEDRAQAVRAYLASQGVLPTRMSAKGYGETLPLESNETQRGRAVNRRVEFLRVDHAARAGAAMDGHGNRRYGR